MLGQRRKPLGEPDHRCQNKKLADFLLFFLVYLTLRTLMSTTSPGNKYFLMDKNVNKGFSTEFDSVGPCKNTHKTPPESSLGKASFSGKIKMAAIKPVICEFF